MKKILQYLAAAPGLLPATLLAQAAAMELEVAPPQNPAMFLNNMKPDHFVFSLIDAVVYVLLMLILVFILRLSLQLLARDEADDTYGKSFLTTCLILAVSGFATTFAYAEMFGIYMQVPVFFIGVLLVRQLCWVPLRKAFGVMLLFTAFAAGLAFFAHYCLDEILPKNRTTLVMRIKKSMGLLDEFAGKEGEAVFTKDTLKNIRSGWALNTEAYKNAVVLLADPSSIDKMVAQHQEDLKALDLLSNGSPPTPEELAALGIVYEDNEKAKRGMDILQHAAEKQAFTEQDVQDVAALLATVRKDKSEVTATDAAIVIREAMRRAQTWQTNKIAGVELGALAGNATGLVATLPPSMLGGVTTASTAAKSPLTMLTGDVGIVISEPVGPGAVRRYDPLNQLAVEERTAWRASKTNLVVTAVFRHHGDQKLVMVNGNLLHTGDVLHVESDGRTFPWRMTDATDYDASWEPVINQKEKGPIPTIIYR